MSDQLREQRRKANQKWLANNRPMYVSKDVAKLLTDDGKENGRTASKQCEHILRDYFEHYLNP